MNTLEFLKKKQKRLENGGKVCDAVFEGSGLWTGLTAGLFATSLLIGGVSSAITEIGYNDYIKSNKVLESDEYQQAVRERAQALTDAFINGEIDYNTYKAESAKAYSRSTIIEYAKNSQDEDLKAFADDYEKSKEFGDAYFVKGLPAFAAGTAIGAAGMAAGYALGKSNKKRKEELNQQIIEEERVSD